MRGMDSSGREIIRDCLVFLLRPLARFCIRHSLSIQDITSALKEVMVDVAKEELVRQGRPLHVSQISVMRTILRQSSKRNLER